MAAPSSTSGRKWSSTNSRQLMKSYDHSPVVTPPKTPVLSRNNSTASIASNQSEPAWKSNRHASESSLGSGDFNELRERRNSSNAQAVTPPATTKRPGFRRLFSHEKDPAKEKEKERKKREKDLKYREAQRNLIYSKTAAETRVKTIMDPAYKEHIAKHKKPQVKTAAYRGQGAEIISAAATAEMRYPHSGKPSVHANLDIPALTRIESHDEPDTQLDQWQALRKEWNEAKEHNIGDISDIPEIRSRQASRANSPWTSPLASRESSPNRRPALGPKRASYGGSYYRDAAGRWRKTPPGQTPSTGHTPTHSTGSLNPDTLAASLAERLNTAALLSEFYDSTTTKPMSSKSSVNNTPRGSIFSSFSRKSSVTQTAAAAENGYASSSV